MDNKQKFPHAANEKKWLNLQLENIFKMNVRNKLELIFFIMVYIWIMHFKIYINNERGPNKNNSDKYLMALCTIFESSKNKMSEDREVQI